MTTTCDSGVGQNNTCAATPLKGTTFELFGLDTDGDVGGVDNFFVGLSCLKVP